jgi:hypothetical protein
VKNYQFDRAKPVYSAEELARFNSEEYLSPYRFITRDDVFICPLGCEPTFDCPREIRKHFINCHSAVELEPWGFKKDLLQHEFLIFLHHPNLEKITSIDTKMGRRRKRDKLDECITLGMNRPCKRFKMN